MEEYTKKVSKAFHELSNAAESAHKGEENYQKNLAEREKVLAEIDGIPMSDEEIETNVEIQSKSSPFRMKVEQKMNKLKQVMIDG
jgi:hypothetical protein